MNQVSWLKYSLLQLNWVWICAIAAWETSTWWVLTANGEKDVENFPYLEIESIFQLERILRTRSLWLRLTIGAGVLEASVHGWSQGKIGQMRFRATMPDSIQQEARQILDTLAFTSFEQCHPLSREFLSIPATVGLYAFRHSSLGLLYIGKAKNLRDRLRGGHKAFLWGWLDRYNPEDVRIAFVTLNQWQKPGLLYELETLILQASNPPYNVKIPREL